MAFWWTDDVQIDIRYQSKHLIRGIITPLDKSTVWAASFVYAPPQQSLRKAFWSLFKKVASKSHYPWLCIGDFNEIGAQSEKYGGAHCRLSQLQAFQELLSDCGLMDLEFKGPPYPWSNNQVGAGNIHERLDRALATVG
ncbi:unnamed protein product [Camellia sinensis]